jgi:hypothetical protein
MAFVTADRVKDTSITTGTGNITVSGSAPFGYRTFSTVLSVSDTFYYCIQGQSTSEWEVGLGTYVSSNQFARTTVLASSASGSAVSFSSGTKNVFITLPANKTLQFAATGTPTAGGVLYGTGSMLAYSTAGTAGQALVSGGTGAPTWSTVTGLGTVTSVNVSGGSTGLTYSGGPITGSGTITMAGTLAVANGGTGVTTSTGSGNLVLSASPTLTGTVTATTITSPSATALTIQSAGTTAMTVDTSQNVGIGTTSPTFSSGSGLAVQRAGVATIRMDDTTHSTAFELKAANGAVAISGRGNYPLLFETNGAEVMRIDSSGNLLVGMTTAIGTGINSSSNFYVGSAGSYWKTTNFSATYYFNYNGSDKASINGSTGAYTALSDANKKKDFETSIIGLAEVMQLQPKLFRMLDDVDDAPKQLGFIAQEVQPLIPQAYSEQDGPDGKKFIGLHDRPIIAALTKAIQELSAKNDALEARLAALEAK